ncbi:MAG TPA: palindromic element RPE4 domain-containing protein [Rickettsia endosymbiont of Pyrocoelia pectoralis]|nr:palindromic element RPE4 domain-containing protein [Rickettsia endosymbiont of Pyrocoelia pectoralis]
MISIFDCFLDPVVKPRGDIEDFFQLQLLR